MIDFTGEIAAKVADYLHQHPGSGYAEVKQRFFADVDGKIVIDTLSPRVFEYTATGNVMVMHEGAYGGIVSPDVHYIPVRKDYSNIDEVFDKMRDPGFCATLAKRARADLIESRVFSYAKFVARFDRIVEAQRAGKVVAPGISAARFYAQRFVSSRQRVVLLGSREIVLRLPQWRSIPFIGPAVEPMVRREQLWRTRLQLLLQIATRRGGAVILAGEFARFLVGVGGDSRLRRAVLRELLLWSALDVAVRGRSGYSPFWLEPSLSGSTLKLESRNVGIPQVGNSLEVLAQARALMRQGKLQRVLWEHRIEGGELSWSYGGRRRVVRLEDRGMVCFESAIRHAAFWHTLSEHLRAQPPS